jgi:MarR family transcriptional regulator, temperature-dependent positive regulator of motility
MRNNDDQLNILRKLGNNPSINQRQLAGEVGVSLGKLNYCLQSLKQKGLIKIKNFKRNKNKLKYLYVLTPHGISTKTKLTLIFMKKKLKEYDELQAEITKTNNKN